MTWRGTCAADLQVDTRTPTQIDEQNRGAAQAYHDAYFAAVNRGATNAEAKREAAEAQRQFLARAR